MEFDKSRVYTAVNADELKVGSKVYVSDNMHYLRECVEDNFESCILTRVMSEKEAKRFCIYDKSNEKWQLAYLIEPPAEPKYKPFSSVEKAMEAIWKHDRWIRDTSHDIFLVSRYCSDFIEVSDHLCDNWKSLSDLFHCYVFADDGSPCGELVEETK